MRVPKITAIIFLVGCAGSKFKHPNDIDPKAYVCQETFAPSLHQEILLEPGSKKRFTALILFKTATSEILSESNPTLDSIAKYLKQNGKPFYIAAHTDMIGPPDRLNELSRERAIVVANILQSKGVNSNQLFPVGVGFRCFIGDANDIQNRVKNRRIEFVEK